MYRCTVTYIYIYIYIYTYLHHKTVSFTNTVLNIINNRAILLNSGKKTQLSFSSTQSFTKTALQSSV